LHAIVRHCLPCSPSLSSSTSFSFSCSRDPRDLHSFPTRRSSDLLQENGGNDRRKCRASVPDVQSLFDEIFLAEAARGRTPADFLQFPGKSLCRFHCGQQLPYAFVL